MALSEGTELSEIRRINAAFRKMGEHMFPNGSPKMDMQDWLKKVDELHDKLTTREKNTDYSRIHDLADRLEKVAIAAEKMVDALEAFKSTNLRVIMVGAVSIISPFAVLVGPEGGLEPGILKIASELYNFLLTVDKPKENFPSRIVRTVKQLLGETLDKHGYEQLKANLYLLMNEEEKLQTELDLQMRAKSPYSGYNPKCYHMITAIQAEVSRKVNEDEPAKFLLLMIVYVHICVLHHSFLMCHLSLARQFDPSHVSAIEGDIDALRQRGRKLLRFLSDNALLSAAGMVDDCKRLKMIAYAERQDCDPVVFISNYCTEILCLPKPNYTLDEARNSLVVWPVKWDPKCEEVQKLNRDHYFALVNHTKLPISVFSGTVGSNVKNLEFQEVVRPGECYTRMCTKGYMFTDFEAGGVLCLGSDAKTLSGVKQAHLIQFAMSYRNPLVGFQASKIKTVISDGPGDPPGQDALNGLENSGDNEDAIPFRYNGDLFILKARADVDLGLGWLQYIPGVDLNVYRVFRFCITQTSIEELKK